MQADAIGILQSHLDTLITRAGLERIETLGRPFDPATMTAVESAADAEKPDHTVLAELLMGWRHAGGELLRPAQVRVSRKPANFQKS
jgi:molecular chaperone GrpE (heat shock protein)